ncbi:sialate O-acetylesterase [Comamonas sp. wu1-DMT]|uniref:sialate O-acetylesterase n=1 Tax=Comamonas sp. wu1-DMT TaxID=3126390 RepID=UPI0032E395AA
MSDATNQETVDIANQILAELQQAARDGQLIQNGYYETEAEGRSDVMDGDTFKVAVPGSPDAILLYRRISSAVSDLLAVLPSSAGVSASIVRESRVTTGTHAIGDLNPSDVGTAYQVGVMVLPQDISKDRVLTRLEWVTGTNAGMVVAIYAVPDGVVNDAAFTRVRRWALPSRVGRNILDANDLPKIVIPAGHVLGIAVTSGALYTNNAASPTPYFNIGGETGSLGPLVVSRRVALRIDTVDSGLLGSGNAEASANDSRIQIDSLGDVPQYIGRKNFDWAPSVGTEVNGTAAFAEPVKRRSRINRVRANVRTNHITLAVYTLSGGDGYGKSTIHGQTTYVRRLVQDIPVTPGLVDLSGSQIPEMIAEPGELIGVYVDGYMDISTEVVQSTPWHSVSGASGNLPGPNPDKRIQISVELRSVVDDSAASIQRAVALAALNGSQTQDTGGFILVFGVGQSNLAGRAIAASKFTVGANRSYKWSPASSALVTLTEPSGTDSTALTGRTSLGSAMAKTVLDMTHGRVGVIFVNAAIGGTRIDTHWAASGSAWTAAVAMFNAAVASSKAKKLNIVGSCCLFVQGESNGDVATDAATYKSAFADLAARVRALMGSESIPIIMAQTGIDNDPTAPADYSVIRAAQSEIAATSANVFMAHAGAKWFADRGWMMDRYHYTAPGYDDVGSSLGAAVAVHAMGVHPTVTG